MGMSIRAYAQHRGVSHEAVRKAIATGRIQTEPDDSIDPSKADAQWDKNTQPGQSSPKASGAADETRGANYQNARAVRETYAARLSKLEFETRSGKLIDVDDTNTKFFNLARQLRERIQQIPRKVSHDIVAAVVKKPDVRDVEDILDAAIRQALEELAGTESRGGIAP